ncbi:MAG: hypothetical protein Q7U74_11890 [Saprospiraceae bacterium]|nr:hypothetical protein [Saprospiraceae bacterium]
MAKQTITKDGITYNLHPVSRNGTKIGAIPVVAIQGMTIDAICEGFRNIVEKNVHSISAADIAKHFHAGLAIALQAQVREMAAGDKISSADINREIDAMPPEELATYAKRFAALQAEGKRRATVARAAGNGTINETYVWTEVL